MRTAATPNKPRIAKTKSFPAPTGGWIKNVNLATPDARLPSGQRVEGAAVLENWFPTATGIRMRGGTEAYAQLEGGGDITALFTYVNGNNQSMFTATADSIFDISNSVFSYLVDDNDDQLVDDNGNFLVDSSLTATMSGFSGGDWSSVQFATTGGVFLDLVNGADKKLIYDGTTFYPIGTTDLVALNYDAEVAPFTEGGTLTGGTSGATGTIVKVIDNGTTGTLWLDSVASGPFQNDEAITDSATGSATADGASTTLFGKIDGVDPASLSHNWVYKNRLFYIEENSLNAWYLAVDSITGTITKLPLGGVFTLGGSLLFGATWSIESGDGLSEQCAFFTTEGEVAVYTGANPADANSWSKVGVYRIGKPKGKKAFIRGGGDLIVATDIGFIPLSIAVQRDIAALSPSAISYRIENAWNDAIAERTGDWNCVVWPTKQMVIVALPTTSSEQAQMFVANARTGAWCLFTGCDATCMAIFGDRAFYGSKDGLVAEMEVTGSDQGTPYTAVLVPLFDPLKSPASLKTGLMARSTVRAPSRVLVGLSLQADFELNLPAPPDDIAVTSENSWGTGVWGTAVWGTAAVKQTFRDWKSIGGSGYSLAVAAQVTSGSLSPPDVEYVETELTYDAGDIGS